MEKQENQLKRKLLVVAAILIQVCLGTVYAFSVFVNPLRETMGWSLNQVSLAFTICLASFTIFMNVAGRVQDQKGPRLTATIGGLLLGFGLIWSGLTSSLIGFYLAYGVMAGAGIGFGYVAPISTLVQWFPERKALMSGLAVFGFGAGPLVLAPTATYLIGLYGVNTTLTLVGVAFLFIVSAAAQFLSLPRPIEARKAIGFDHNQPIWQTGRFWRLWLYFLVGAGAGLMVISQAAPLAQELAGLSAVEAASIVGLLALTNGLGRLLWGFVADKFGYERTIAVIFVLFTLDLLVVLQLAANQWLLSLGLLTAAFSFGGVLALMPALTSKYFGDAQLGRNYALVFSAYGVAGVLGPMAISMVFTRTGSYMSALWFYGLASLLAWLSFRPFRKIRLAVDKPFK